MKNLILAFFCLVIVNCEAQGVQNKSYYENVYKELKGMLNDSLSPSFKRAVFITENAYVNNTLNYNDFNQTIAFYTDLCRKIAKQGSLEYNESDRETVKKYWSVFLLMTDSIPFALDDKSYFVSKPFRYDFEDFWGEKDWKKMFVTKLLQTNTGNCHSLPFLYKIICEELGAKAWLSMAPSHSYIKLWTKKTGWFNTELTSGYFPIDAWIMSSGYIHLEAVQNRVYMDTLSVKQSIALNLTDLAKGYEKKYGDTDLNFILKCTDLALKYYPLYTNAMLLKAETLKKKFASKMKLNGAKYPSDMFNVASDKKLFDEMEQLYSRIYEVGYRTMPKEMYLTWLTELKQEREKYTNSKVISSFKSNN